MLGPGVLDWDLDSLLGESLYCCDSVDVEDLDVVAREEGAESTVEFEVEGGVLEVEFVQLGSEETGSCCELGSEVVQLGLEPGSIDSLLDGLSEG